jgi:acetate kinase
VEQIGEAAGPADHAQALGQVVESLQAAGHHPCELAAVGHRVVHGGERFQQATRVDDDLLEAIRALTPLAPLHNPANLMGIEVMQGLAPQTPQFAVFDTAFHQTMPPEAYRYALPESYFASHGIRRYGFHGISHQYISREAARRLDRPADQIRLISLHLGNGASATAIRDGQSIDTSMGMTPLAGLLMGSRTGDIDPGVLLFLQRELGMDAQRLDRLLNRESGLKGMVGSNDMRQVLAQAEAGDDGARLAVALFAYRIRSYIGAYLAILGGLDGLVFTGGIGEHSAEIRGRCCAGLGHLDIALDSHRNAAPGEDGRIDADSSRIRILVIPANEELEIARQVSLRLGSA